MAAIKRVFLVYFVLLSSGFCYGGRVLNEEVEKASNNHGTGTTNGDGNGDGHGGSNGAQNPDSGDSSTDHFRFPGIIAGWNGRPVIEVPGFDIPVIGVPNFGIPSFNIGGGIDIDFGGSDDPEHGDNGGSDTKPGAGETHDSSVDGDSSVRGRNNGRNADNDEAWEKKNKMQEMMGHAQVTKESEIQILAPRSLI